MMYTENIIDPLEDKKTKTVKTAVRYIVIGLVGIFAGAVTNCVVGGTSGPKAAKMCANAGGFLTGLYMGGKVSDYICEGIDIGLAKLEELKDAIDEEG